MISFASRFFILTLLVVGSEAIGNEVTEKKLNLRSSSEGEAKALPKEGSSFTPVGGGIEVDLDKGLVRMPIELVGKGNEKDPSRSLGLEFLVTIGMDKDYESMFSSKARGQNLHMALLMIGLEPSKAAKEVPASANLQIEIQIGEERRLAKDWLLWSNGKLVDDLDWYFRGSELTKVGERTEYAADQALNLVATLPSSSMVVGPAVDVGNPYNQEDVYLVPALLPERSLGAQGWIWFQAR
jgi:hypothetical protein